MPARRCRRISRSCSESGKRDAALYTPLASNPTIPDIMKLLDTFTIHHIIVVGIIGMQKRSMALTISLSRRKSEKNLHSFAVIVRNAMEHTSASITDRRYPTFPSLKVNSRTTLNTMFITVVRMPSIA